MSSSRIEMQQTAKSQNLSSPYYLHLGENSGMVLVSPQLNENNFHSWQRAMKRALLSKNKLKFVDGSIEAPSKTDALYEAWERCNVMVIAWITRSMSNQIAQSVIYIDDAKELWKDYKKGTPKEVTSRNTFH